MARTLTRSRADYEEDFHAWLMEQAALARAGRTGELDLDNIAEELESLGRSDRREIRNRMKRLVEHLLKLALSQAAQPRPGWRRTVREQRRQIRLILDDSPSLRTLPATLLDEVYKDVAEDLAETSDPGTVPDACPFTVDQVLDRGYFPEPPSGREPAGP